MRTNEKRPILAYWIPTVLIALLWTFGGTSALLRTDSSVEVIRRLGYPPYFGVMLGVAQLLGVAAILAPVPRTLREWAYAGLVFDVVAAIVSSLAIGSPLVHLIFPVLALTMLSASYRAWRRCLGEAAA